MVKSLAPSSSWIVQTSGEGSNRYGRANTNYPVLETYTEGSILEVKVVASTTHMVSSVRLYGSSCSACIGIRHVRAVNRIGTNRIVGNYRINESIALHVSSYVSSENSDYFQTVIVIKSDNSVT